jgi:hypothetical protein
MSIKYICFKGGIMARYESKLLYMLFVFGVIALLKGCKEAQAESLKSYSTRLGFKAPVEVYSAISKAAKAYGLDPTKMLAIGLIESGLNPVAFNFNSNGTLDYGLFQINTVIASSECLEYNIYTIIGNSYCAAKVIKRHKLSGDPYYLGRFHSKTPSRKIGYYNKLKELEQ